MGDDEARFYVTQQRKYQAENKFTAVTDLQDMDRLLFCELLNFRYQHWLGKGANYHNEVLGSVGESDLRKAIKQNNAIISGIKNDLGLTKSQRDKEQYESVGSYLVQLRARAMEHGVRREKQLGKAIALINEMFAMIGAFDRANEVERRKLGLETEADILDWVRSVMRPEFEEIDAYFRKHQQRFWVRDL